MSIYHDSKTIVSVVFILWLAGPVGFPAQAQPGDRAPFRVVDHTVFDLLDEQHVGNLLYRPGPDGGQFIGFGRIPMQA